MAGNSLHKIITSQRIELEYNQYTNTLNNIDRPAGDIVMEDMDEGHSDDHDGDHHEEEGHHGDESHGDDDHNNEEHNH